MKRLLPRLRGALNAAKSIDFLGPAALRLYLAPIFILAGMSKLGNAENVAGYFEYLGIPFPGLMVYLAGLTEFVGGILLIPGIAVRLMAVPLMATMVVAGATAHWENGWHVLPETELTMPWEWRQDLIDGAVERRARARTILREHGNYDWLTETGPFTILKNGVEFAATYFIMLLALFCSGAGRLSIDHLIARRLAAPDVLS
ncbi:MAG: HvfX family Cu-binding RiPP maturation protein [Woeseiaceae bacterium]